MSSISTVLYSTGCPKCCILKKKLEEKNIQYTEDSSVEKMLSMGITQVPVLDVDGVKMNFKESVDWIKEQ